MSSPTLSLDPASTALVLIDLQNGIVSRDTRPHAAADVVERSRRMAEAFRAKGAPVIYVHVNLADFMELPADEVSPRPRDLPAEASQIASSAGMQPGDRLVAKRQWGAFAGTDLEAQLRALGVRTVVLAGIATNMGVESTLRQGTGLGFGFVTVEDACTTFSDEMQSFAFTMIFPRLSRVRNSSQVIASLA